MPRPSPSLVDLVVDARVRALGRALGRRPGEPRRAPPSAASASFVATISAKLGSSASKFARPDAGVLAEPRREVLLPGEPVALLGELLVDQLAQLRRRIVGAHDLAGGGERVLAPVALRLDRRLDVDRRAGGHERRRVAVAARAGLAARRGGERQDGAGERERGGAEHESSPFESSCAALPHRSAEGADKRRPTPGRRKPPCSRACCTRIVRSARCSGPSPSHAGIACKRADSRSDIRPALK